MTAPRPHCEPEATSEPRSPIFDRIFGSSNFGPAMDETHSRHPRDTPLSYPHTPNAMRERAKPAFRAVLQARNSDRCVRIWLQLVDTVPRLTNLACGLPMGSLFAALAPRRSGFCGSLSARASQRQAWGFWGPLESTPPRLVLIRIRVKKALPRYEQNPSRLAF